MTPTPPIDPNRDKAILRKLQQTMDPQGWIEDSQIANVTRVPLDYVRDALRRFSRDRIVERRELTGARAAVQWRMRP